MSFIFLPLPNKIIDKVSLEKIALQLESTGFALPHYRAVIDVLLAIWLRGLLSRRELSRGS